MHYRLSLTKGRGSVKLISERHSYSHTAPSGWWRSVHLLGSSVHIKVCWIPDEACDKLNGRDSGSRGDTETVRAVETTGAAANPVAAGAKEDDR